MILDNPILQDMVLGAERVILQPADAQVEIKSQILTTARGQLRTIFPNASARIANNGLYYSLSIYMPVSTALVTVTLAVLPKGLYTIQIFMCSRIVGTKAGGAGGGMDGPQIKFQTAFVGNLPLMGFMHNAGPYFQNKDIDVLLTDETNLQYVAPATGAGEAHDTTVSVNVIRRI